MKYLMIVITYFMLYLSLYALGYNSSKTPEQRLGQPLFVVIAITSLIWDLTSFNKK